MEGSSLRPWRQPMADSEACQFCTTCTIDAEEGAISCTSGIADAEGGRITLKTEGGQITAIRQDGTGETLLGALALPEMADTGRSARAHFGIFAGAADTFLLRR